MNMLKKWCDRTWLYLVYFIGVVMACTLVWHWLVTNPVMARQIILGIVALMCIMVGLILLPFVISMRVKSQRFAFDDKGYFEKYESEK